MAVFSYKAVSPDGSEISGKSSAASRSDAIKTLSDAGYAVYDIVEGSQGLEVPWYRRELFQGNLLKDGEIGELSLTLSAMLERHLAIDEALAITADTASSSRIRQHLRKVHTFLIAGETVEDAFRSIDDAFPEEFLLMVKAGAASNTLGPAFARAAAYFMQRTQVRRDLLAAMAYPLFLILAATIVFGIILFMLIPSLYETLVSAGGDMDGTIATMQRFGLWLTTYWIPMLSIIVGLVIVSVLLRRQILSLTLRIAPPLQRHQARLFYARVARILSTLMNSGERMDAAVSNTASMLNSSILSEPLNDALQAIRQGEQAGGYFLKDKRVPELFARFFDLGERSNNLPALMTLAAETLDAQYAATLKRMTALLTPILTLFVGGIIALVVQVLISAVLEISQIAI